MTNSPNSSDPIAQLVAKYQSNGHQTIALAPQPAPQPRKKKDRLGFAERTLWDWLQFLVQLFGIIAIPFVIFLASNTLTTQQSAISQNQFQEDLLKTFRDDINRLVFDQQLLTAKRGDPVQIMAQSYTNDAVRKLDLSRRALLVQFLGDLHLITSTPENYPLIWLIGVDLSGAKLIGVDLSGAKLIGVELSGANLALADLIWVNLSGIDLSRADLIGAKVTPEQLASAYSLKDAILPDGSHYPSTSYPIPNHQEPTN